MGANSYSAADCIDKFSGQCRTAVSTGPVALAARPAATEYEWLPAGPRHRDQNLEAPTFTIYSGPRRHLNNFRSSNLSVVT